MLPWLVGAAAVAAVGYAANKAEKKAEEAEREANVAAKKKERAQKEKKAKERTQRKRALHTELKKQRVQRRTRHLQQYTDEGRMLDRLSNYSEGELWNTSRSSENLN